MENFIFLAVEKISSVTSGWRREGLPYLLQKIVKKCSGFEKKTKNKNKNGLIVFIYELNFSFEMLVSRWKNREIFPCKDFLSCLVGETFIKVSSFKEVYPSLKKQLVAPLLCRSIFIEKETLTQVFSLNICQLPTSPLCYFINIYLATVNTDHQYH